MQDEGGLRDDRTRPPGNDVENLFLYLLRGGVRGGVKRRDKQPGKMHAPLDTSHSHGVASLLLPPLLINIVPPPSPSPIALPSLRRRPSRLQLCRHPASHCTTTAIAQRNHAAKLPSPMTLLSLSRHPLPPHRHHPSLQPLSITIFTLHIMIPLPSYCPLCPSRPS